MLTGSKQGYKNPVWPTAHNSVQMFHWLHSTEKALPSLNASLLSRSARSFICFDDIPSNSGLFCKTFSVASVLKPRRRSSETTANLSWGGAYGCKLNKCVIWAGLSPMSKNGSATFPSFRRSESAGLSGSTWEVARVSRSFWEASLVSVLQLLWDTFVSLCPEELVPVNLQPRCWREHRKASGDAFR